MALPCALLSAADVRVPGFPGVTAAWAASAHIAVLDPAMTLTPSAADYTNDYVEITGAAGIRLQFWTNSPAGCAMFVQCTDAAPRIALADFLVKTGTPPGAGGASMTTFTAVTAANQGFWSTGVAVPPWGQVNFDIRIKNLYAYPDGIGGGTTAYTNNLTFTVVVQ